MGFDIGIILGELVDDTAVGGIEIESFGLTGVADLLDPSFSLIGNFVGALAFIVGNVNIDAGDFGLASLQCAHDDVLKGAQIIGILPYQQRIEAGGWHRKLDDVVLYGGIDCDVDTEKGQ